MKKVFVTFVALLVVFVLTVTASESEPPVTTNSAPNDSNCSQVMNNLFVSCVDYLIGGDAIPSGVCCQSVNAVKASTQTQIQRVTACMCYHDVAIKLPFLLDDRAGSLSQSCGVDLGFVMSANTDCINVPVSSRQGRE